MTDQTATPRPEQQAAGTRTDWTTRIILGAVMAAALAVGTWSIYTLLTNVFGAPKPIALLGCGMFDVAAFFFARLSQRYATTTDSGLAPRAAMLAMICTSSWVNWRHAQLEHWGTVGSVILAAAPIIAELSFEMWHRFEHREALRRLGRVAQTLPVLGKWAWLFHPARSRKVIDAHIRAGLTEHQAVAERRVEIATDRARNLITLPETANSDRQDIASTTAIERQEDRQNAASTAASTTPIGASIHELAAANWRQNTASSTPELAATGDNATANTTANTAPSGASSDRQNTANDSAKTPAKSIATSANTRQKRVTANASGAAKKTAKTRRSMDEWVELATPVFHAQFAKLRRQPTGPEFADAIAEAGYGRPGDSTAKNIRTAILDRTPVPALD